MSVYKEFGPAQIALTTVQSILIILNIAGNSLVCVIILKNQDMRTSINYLIMNLAVADITVATFFAPQYIFTHIFTHPDGATGDVLCRLLTGESLAWVGGGASIFTLVAISIERYYAVLHPYGNKGKLTHRKLKMIIPCSWLFGAILSMPEFLFKSFNNKLDSCTYIFPVEWMGRAYGSMWLVFSAFVPISLMVALYSRIVYALWFKRTESIESNNTQQGVLKVRKRVTLMVITVSVIFGVCWLTESIHYLLVSETSTLALGDTIDGITNALIMFNSTINPMVYALVNQRFREKMKLLIFCTCRPATERIHSARESQTEGMQDVDITTNPTLETMFAGKPNRAFTGHPGITILPQVCNTGDQKKPYIP